MKRAPESPVENLQAELRVTVWFEDAWTKGPPDWARLAATAESQGGLFTTADARACGCTRSVISYHARRGRFDRVRRGLYRLANHPPAPFERERIEWIAAGREHAVLSHESALHVLGYIAAPPPLVHLTVAWDRRWYRSRTGTRVHTRGTPWPKQAVSARHGMLVTRAERALVEAVEGFGPDELLKEALRAALADGAVDRHRLMERARGRRPRRVAWKMADLIEEQGRADLEDLTAESRRPAPPST